MQLAARTLMDVQIATAAPARAEAAAGNGSLTTTPTSSWGMGDTSALLPAVAVLLLSTGLACGVDATTACMWLAAMLRAGAWVYAAFIFAAAVLTVACLIGQQPQQQQQQRGGEVVQEVQEPVGVQTTQGSRSAGGLMSSCKQVGATHLASPRYLVTARTEPILSLHANDKSSPVM
jgi:hypothetical protein